MTHDACRPGLISSRLTYSVEKCPMDAVITSQVVAPIYRAIARIGSAIVRRLCIVALVLALGANVAAAQVTLSLPDTAVTAGTLVSVPIQVTGFNNVGSFTLRISFDKTVLTYAGLVNAPATSLSSAVSTANANGYVDVVWFSLTPLNIGTGKLMDILFTFGNGSSALTFVVPSSITDALGNPFVPPATFTSGRVRPAGGILPPATPTLASPSNGATNQATSITLSWFTATGATAYHLQVSTSFGFGTNVFDDPTVTTTSRTVSSLSLNTSYFWRVRSMNAAGYSAFSDARSFTTVRTTQVETSNGLVPKDFELSQNYPNPFNPSTIIPYSLPTRSHVTLAIFNTMGQEVGRLVDAEMEPGYHEARFDAAKLSSGIYFYRLQARQSTGAQVEGVSAKPAQGFVETKRMVLQK